MMTAEMMVAAFIVGMRRKRGLYGLLGVSSKESLEEEIDERVRRAGEVGFIIEGQHEARGQI